MLNSKINIALDFFLILDFHGGGGPIKCIKSIIINIQCICFVMILKMNNFYFRNLKLEK